MFTTHYHWTAIPPSHHIGAMTINAITTVIRAINELNAAVTELQLLAFLTVDGSVASIEPGVRSV